MASLSRLLRPKSIAVFGGGWSENVIRQCQNMGFMGDIWPVHPAKSELAGLPCFASVSDLPAAPDASFIGVNRDATIDIVGDLSRCGAGGAVCFASGFKEVSDGRERQERLIAAAGSMPILGPNCYGLINYLDGALLWPDQHGGKSVETGVAIIVQSSNIAINLTMQKRALPIAYILTAGNQAQTGISELADAALDDPRVTCLGLHIEGFDDIRKFEQVMHKAHRLKKPVIILKVGKSTAAQSLTLTHTASLAGSDNLATAFINRVGAARVHSLDDFVETLKLLHVLGPSPDATLGSLSCSGGEASLVGDLAHGTGLDLRTLTGAEINSVGATLPDMVTISNPLDYHTFSWGDRESLTETYASMLALGFGLTLLILDFPRPDRCRDNGSAAAAAAAIDAVKKTSGRLAVVSSLPENMTEDVAQVFLDAGVAPLMGLQSAMVAASVAANLHQKRIAPFALPLNLPPNEPVPNEPVTLDENQSKSILTGLGIPVPKSAVATSPDDAATLATTLGFPVVVKVLGAELSHKTELAGVALNLNTSAEVHRSAEKMSLLSSTFLVEQMIVDPVAELIIGIARDPQFGLYLTIGAGGVMVELLNDVVPILLPTTAQDLRTSLLSLKTSALLTGFRGKPAGDIDAFVDIAMRIGDYAIRENRALEELDINPILVCESGAVAVDALIRTRNSVVTEQ